MTCKVTVLAGLCCFGLVSEAMGGDSPAGLAHPGISHSHAELVFVKSKLKAGEQPWQQAWEALRSSKYASLSWKTMPECGGSSGVPWSTLMYANQPAELVTFRASRRK